MASLKPYPFILGFIVLFCFVQPTLAFGAGNIAGISKIEGQNCKRRVPCLFVVSLLLVVLLLVGSWALTGSPLNTQGATVTSRMPSSRSSWPAPSAASASTS